MVTHFNIIHFKSTIQIDCYQGAVAWQRNYKCFLLTNLCLEEKLAEAKQSTA